MKRIAALYVLAFGAAWLLLGPGAWGQQQAPERSAPAPKAVSVDADFTEALEDFQMVQGEIARIEKAEGTVEIPVSLEKLRRRAQVKVDRLNKWIKDRGVEGWSYNPQMSRFDPPSPKAARPAMPKAAEPATPKAEEKKPAEAGRP